MSDLTLPGNIVSADWLNENISNEHIVVLDASWHLPAKARSGKDEYLTSRIPGAKFFDYDGKIKDQNNELPRMLPTEELFTRSVCELGVNQSSTVIVYDKNGMFSSPRAWWMFKAMGHDRVAVLDGGFDAWQASQYQVETDQPKVSTAGDFKAKINVDKFVDDAFVLNTLNSTTRTILDARSQERFDAGHMPSAKNLPYTELLDNGKLKSIEEVKRLIQQQVSADQSLLCSCGSGVTACVVALGAAEAGVKDIAVYDASWSQWGNGDEKYPVQTS